MFRTLFLFLLLVLCFSSFSGLKFSIEENHHIKVEPFKTPINKRDISQFFDEGKNS